MAKTTKAPAKRGAAASASNNDAAVVRKQLIWIVGILAAVLLLSGGVYWGRETGWGNPAKAVARKMAQGEAAFVAGDLDGAVRFYQTVVKRYPKDAQAIQAMTQSATALQQLGRLTEALQTLADLDQRLAASNEQSDLKAYTLLQIAKVKKDLGDMDGARIAYERVRSEHPKTDWAGEAQTGLGAVLQAQKKYKEARAAYAVLVKELPGGFLAAEAQTAIGECFEAEGDYKQAQRAYQTVIDKYPQAVWDSAKARLDALKKDLESAQASKKTKG